MIDNKYVIIALIIALIVVLYLYSQKKSCDVEGMKNIDLTPLSQELVEKPWEDNRTDNVIDGKYKSVNNNFDKFADQHTKKKTGRNNTLKRRDEIFQEYVKYDGYDTVIPENISQKRKIMPINSNEVPKPLDDRPDLSQCQPCICPGDDDDDDDDDYELYKLKKQRKKNARTKKLNY